MEPVWIGTISALAGVLLGSIADFLRVRYTFRRERTWELEHEQGRRLERLYESVEELRESYGLAVADMILKLSQPQAVEREIRCKVPWSRLRLLINLYAPDLRPRLQVLTKTGNSLGAVLADCVVQGSADPQANTDLLAKLKAASDNLNDAADALCEDIVANSRHLADRAQHGIGADMSPSTS